VQRTSQQGYVQINKKGGCYSSVGYGNRMRQMSLAGGCLSKGIIIHEFLHAIGLWHEQSRPDRDQYVDVFWNNMVSTMKHNFNKNSNSRTLGFPYDYGSIMHYGKYGFSNNGQPTLLPKDRSKHIGQRKGMSSVDAGKVNALYKCSGGGTVTPTQKPITGSTCKGYCVAYCYTNEYEDTNAKCSNNQKCCMPKTTTNKPTVKPTQKPCKGGCYSSCIASEFIDITGHCSSGNKCCVPKSTTKPPTTKGPCASPNSCFTLGKCGQGWEPVSDQVCSNTQYKCCKNSYTTGTKPCKGGCYSSCISSEYHDTEGQCLYGNKCCVANGSTNPPTQKPVYCKGTCATYCYSSETVVTNQYCTGGGKCCIPKVTQPPTQKPLAKCKGGCYQSCISSEYHDTNGYCSAGYKCCVQKTVTNKPTSGPIVTNGPVVTDGKCGKTKFDFGYNPRIVGGRQAKKGEFPWQVQIQRNGGHYCGGTVLDNQWVLTAAHCMGGPSSQYKFVVGQHDKYANEGTEQIFSASKIIVHENYGNGNMRYDIALIKLNGKVQFNDYARTACMPSHNENFVGETNCIVSGWGALKEGSGGPRILNAVSKPVISNTVCKQAYSGIYDSNICGGFAAGGKDACQGDSGGPYVCKKAGQPWKIVGVVSWGHGCARPGKYGVYASVPFFYNWIKSNQAKY